MMQYAGRDSDEFIRSKEQYEGSVEDVVRQADKQTLEQYI